MKPDRTEPIGAVSPALGPIAAIYVLRRYSPTPSLWHKAIHALRHKGGG